MSLETLSEQDLLREREKNRLGTHRLKLVKNSFPNSVFENEQTDVRKLFFRLW